MIQKGFNESKNSTCATLAHQQQHFNDLVIQTKNIIATAFKLYNKVQSQTQHIETYNQTMQELDEVFTRSNNQQVARELSLMQETIQQRIVKLQSEYHLIKSTCELSQDLLNVIRQGFSRKLKQKKGAQSHDMSDLAGALDRIQDLENRLESSQMEGQRLKRELNQMQKDSERNEMNLTDRQKTLEVQIRGEIERLDQQTRRVRELEDQLYKEQSQVQSLINVNEELRSLFEQERAAAA